MLKKSKINNIIINWKISFLILLVVNVLLISVIFIFVLSPVGGPKLNLLKGKEDKKDVGFYVQTNKEDLTKIVNYYIEKEGLDGPIDYYVHLSDEVELYGSMLVFNQEIELKMTFEPEALDNGDLLLYQKSISIGQLNLPVSYILKFIRNSYKLPEWVKIYPDEEVVYVALNEMKLKSDMKVKAEDFNLKRNRISFRLFIHTDDPKKE